MHEEVYGTGTIIYCQPGPNLLQKRAHRKRRSIYLAQKNKKRTKLKEYKMELIGTYFSSLRWYWTWVGWALAQDVITVLTLLKSAST
jgi:hypothetical protein